MFGCCRLRRPSPQAAAGNALSRETAAPNQPQPRKRNHGVEGPVTAAGCCVALARVSVVLRCAVGCGLLHSVSLQVDHLASRNRLLQLRPSSKSQQPAVEQALQLLLSAALLT